MVCEAPEISAFSKYRQREHRTNARKRPKRFVVLATGEQLVSLFGELVALLDEVLIAPQLKAEALDLDGSLFHGQSNASMRNVVKLLQPRRLVDLAADQLPCGLPERVVADAANRLRRRKADEKSRKPFGMRTIEVSLYLREVQRQVVRQEAVLQARSSKADLVVCFR